MLGKSHPFGGGAISSPGDHRQEAGEEAAGSGA